ncbi:uncharacterized protein N7479_005971 [Penicillium vulpinum]|uniref:Fungal-type protein kinase domain-containing protein n=1 Tax=Penicillium vulpinum TaxID=29845 RepID=A0A1V6SES1_9EURO|nr:uncharacterized protein N7479_005971 [Penicillium vulpinum]KAJ5958821.1 hypothetical protein N7479_005971 [Penicillium vulpinum]OQE12495.1 hypothetical protein PENVUL_c001G09980 [Penicillium vulpinum]
MPSLANIPTSWKTWWGRLNKLANSSEVNTNKLKDFIAKPPREPEMFTVSASDMTPTDVNDFFGLSEVQGYETWQFSREFVQLGSGFESWINTFEDFTRSSKPTEARSRCKIDVLLHAVYEDLQYRGFLEEDRKATLQFETSLEWGPVKYLSKPYKCVGKADYSLFLGNHNHMACHLVILEAKQDRNAASGQGQLLAYMAMVQASRKARGQSDSTVWGALSDGHWFYFFRLNNTAKWSVVAYQVSRDGWGAIANMIAFMILQGYQTALSPLRSSGSSNPSARASIVSAKAPRLPSLHIKEVIEESVD